MPLGESGEPRFESGFDPTRPLAEQGVEIAFNAHITQPIDPAKGRSPEEQPIEATQVNGAEVDSTVKERFWGKRHKLPLPGALGDGISPFHRIHPKHK